MEKFTISPLAIVTSQSLDLPEFSGFSENEIWLDKVSEFITVLKSSIDYLAITSFE